MARVKLVLSTGTTSTSRLLVVGSTNFTLLSQNFLLILNIGKSEVGKNIGAGRGRKRCPACMQLAYLRSPSSRRLPKLGRSLLVLVLLAASSNMPVPKKYVTEIYSVGELCPALKASPRDKQCQCLSRAQSPTLLKVQPSGAF